MNTRADTAIEMSGLTKPFGPTKILNDLDPTVNTGEMNRFLGEGQRRTAGAAAIAGMTRTPRSRMRCSCAAARKADSDPPR